MTTTQSEATPIEEPQSSEPQPSQEPPQLTELQAQNQKLQRDLSSLRGQIRSQEQVNAGIETRLDALGRQLVAIGRSQTTGDTESLATELVQIEQEQGQQAAQRLFNQEAESQRAYVVQILDQKDDSGQPLVNTQDSVIQEASQEFLAAWQTDGPVQQRLTQLNAASRKIAARAAELAWEQAKSAAAEARQHQQRLQEAQLEETDLEPGSTGTASPTDADLFAAFGRGESLTPQQKARVGRYRQQLLRGR